MTHPFAPPQARHVQPEAEPATAFSAAFNAQERPFDVYDVDDVFGLGGKPIPKIAIVVPRVLQQRHAIEAADRALSTATDTVRNDPDASDNEKQIELLYRVCKNPENIKHDAFPGPKWMRENLSTDQLGAMLNLLALTRRKYGPGGLKSFEPAEVDAFAHGLQATDPATAYSRLGIMNHADLAGLCMVLAAHYVANKGEIEALRLALPADDEKPEEG